MRYKMVALCPDEIRPVLEEELQNLCVTEINSRYKAVSFEVDERLYYLSHLKLATASSLLRVITDSYVDNLRSVHSLAAKIAWHTLFAATKTFKVDVQLAVKGKHFPSSNDISRQIRTAVEYVFSQRGEAPPRVDVKKPHVIITAYCLPNKVMLSLNTARTSLHKRGYRVSGHPAPLKETMAAALLRLSGYSGQKVLLDPMCGSGTIAIEAAYLSLKKSPLIHRKKHEFGFEHLLDFNSELWRSIQEDVRQEKQEQLHHKIYASDLDRSYVSLAKDNALRARVEKHIVFSQSSFFDVKPPEAEGLLITNLPYGKRIGDAKELKAFYQQIGDHLKQNFSNWQAALFVDEEAPWKFIGLRPKKKFSLLNGSIKTKLLLFDLYVGSKKTKSQKIEG